MKYLFASALVLVLSSPAFAQRDVVSTGIPVEPTVNRFSPLPYNDIYERQLLYRMERLEFRRRIEERRAEFAAPRQFVHARYEQNMEELDSFREDYNGEID